MVFRRPFLLLLAKEQDIYDLVCTFDMQENVESIESIYLSDVKKKTKVVNMQSCNLWIKQLKCKFNHLTSWKIKRGTSEIFITRMKGKLFSSTFYFIFLPLPGLGVEKYATEFEEP